MISELSSFKKKNNKVENNILGEKSLSFKNRFFINDKKRRILGSYRENLSAVGQKWQSFGGFEKEKTERMLLSTAAVDGRKEYKKVGCKFIIK